MCPYWEMQEFEGETIWAALFVRAGEGRCPASQRLSTHCPVTSEGSLGHGEHPLHTASHRVSTHCIQYGHLPLHLAPVTPPKTAVLAS